MKVKINGTVGELLYPVVLGSPVYLLFAKGGLKIDEVLEILEYEDNPTTEKLVTKFKTKDKIYEIEY